MELKDLEKLMHSLEYFSSLRMGAGLLADPAS